MLRRAAACSFALLLTLPAALSALSAQSAPRPLPALADATRIHDTKADTARSWPDLLDALAKFDVVFAGETHVDDTTHQAELALLEGLLQRKQGKVVLSLEMFERDVQPALDAYVAGRIDEATFLQRSRPWHNYRTGYRPLVEAAKAAKIPVIAANFPVALRRALGSGNTKAAVDKLSPEQRALMPADIFPASAEYWERVDRAVRGHMGGGGSGGTPEERLWDTQNLWDNAMGDAVAKARAAHPDHTVLHVAGGFHVAYRDGTVAQFARRSEGSTFAVVSIAPVSELHMARPDRDREQADFVVYARTLSREWNDGNWAVDVPGELRYRLAAPPGSTPVPLLLWLPDRGTRTDDALAWWRAVLGNAAAVAVIEHPFPEVQDDLALGGRYVFGDGFRSDYSRVSHGLARIAEYVTRKFAVDGERIVVAGAGDGGAVVLWTALYGEWLAGAFVAVDPNDLSRLAMEGLPDQKPVARSLALLAQRTDKAKLEAIAADYTKVGTPTSCEQVDAGAHALAARVRRALGVEAKDAAATAHTQPVLQHDTERARQWADLFAAGSDQPFVIGGDGRFPVASFADGSGIPLAGGPFGGTTIVVLPKGTSDADRAVWLEHEKAKVLKRRNMFANIAIAADGGEPSLRDVVTQLRTRGRLRFLIVPALFCADAATMQSLRAQLGDAGIGADIAWLPGLGAELAAARR